MALGFKDFDDERVANLRLIFVIAARDKMEMHHCDIPTAFSNGVLKEELYMMQLPNYCETLKGSKKKW